MVMVSRADFVLFTPAPYAAGLSGVIQSEVLVSVALAVSLSSATIVHWVFVPRR